MREDESPLLAEMHDALGDLSKNLDPSFWDSYFRAYDLLVMRSGAYRELLDLAHGHLPLAGAILDLGAGTGNFSVSLAGSAPHRTFLLVDQSPTGLEIAGAKFRALTSHRDPRHTAFVRSLLDEAPLPAASGAVMNNVLYSIGAVADKRAVLARIHAALTAGGAFFLNDPLPTTCEAAFFRETFLHVVAGALLDDSPMTEFDLAVLTAANLRLTKAEGKPDQSSFLAPAEITALAEEVGFALEHAQPTYAGISQAFFLRKR
jgi:ubiquinone/menaquinone biosynthesis C-methylase UbiE